MKLRASSLRKGPLTVSTEFLNETAAAFRLAQKVRRRWEELERSGRALDDGAVQQMIADVEREIRRG